MGREAFRTIARQPCSLSVSAKYSVLFPNKRRSIKELHRSTADQIGVDADTRTDIERLLNELQLLLTGISILKDLTPRSRDTLVSFGERLSTRLFAALLHKQVESA